MMSPTGSPITSPPSEPSSYDEPRGVAMPTWLRRPLAWLPIGDLDRAARADVAVGGRTWGNVVVAVTQGREPSSHRPTASA